MADEPKTQPASATDLKALAERMKTLETAKPIDLSHLAKAEDLTALQKAVATELSGLATADDVAALQKAVATELSGLATADDVAALRKALMALQDRVDGLENAGGGELATVYPWRHTGTGDRARIIRQDTETEFEIEAGGVHVVDTPTFSRQFEDATQAPAGGV